MAITKCCPPEQTPYEYELPNIIIPLSGKLKINIPKTDICKLKMKVYKELLDIICKLENGIQPSLELILEEISAVQLENILDNKREFVIQYYNGK